MKRLGAGASVAAVLLVGSLWAAEAFKSGPQVGDPVGTPFDPLHVNGPTAGKKACLV